jgi:hypothetical protein
MPASFAARPTPLSPAPIFTPCMSISISGVAVSIASGFLPRSHQSAASGGYGKRNNNFTYIVIIFEFGQFQRKQQKPMKQITAILFLTFFCHLNPLYSQSKTPYEKKVDQIMTEMCEVIGVENSLIQMALKLNDWDIVRTSQDFAFKCKMMDKNELLVVVMATEQKLKEAEKLKNDIDRKKDADKKAKEEKEKRLEEEKALIEKQAIEDKKRQEELRAQEEIALRRQNEKIQQEEQAKINRYNNSHYVDIVNKVSLDFNKWLNKGEFEKTEDYNLRMNNSEYVFDSICNQIITQKREWGYSSYLYLGTYNPDLEIFPVRNKIRKCL